MAQKTSPSGGARGIALVTLGNVTSPVVALVTAPLLARALGADGRGEVAAATAPLMLAAAALTLGLPDAATHFTAKFGGLQRRLVWSLLASVVVAGIAGAVGIYALAPILSAGNEGLTALIRIASTAIPIALIAGIVRGFARGLRRWGLVALEQAVSAAFKLIGICAFFFTDRLNPTSASAILVIGTFVGAVVYLPLLRKREATPVGHQISVATALQFGLSAWVGSVAGIALSRLDQLLILPLSSAAALGIYALSVSIADVIRVFNSAVRDVVFADQSARLDDRKLAAATRISTAITTAAGAVLATVSFLVVTPVFGREFSTAAPVIAILILGTVLGNPGSVLAAGLTARGRPLLRSLSISVGLVANIVLVILLVPTAGAMGAAIAAGIANVIAGATVFLFAWMAFAIRPGPYLGVRKGDVAEARRMLGRALKKRKDR